jgi:hypothetical protein
MVSLDFLFVWLSADASLRRLNSANYEIESLPGDEIALARIRLRRSSSHTEENLVNEEDRLQRQRYT